MWVVILAFLVSASGVQPVNNVQAQTLSSTLDPVLKETLSATEGPVEVIVSFNGDGPLSKDNLALLDSVGIEVGVSLQSLPMAGVLATEKQINKLLEHKDILSVYANEELEYFNANSTDLTGVNKVRTNRDFQKENGGFPFTGKGVGVVVNDSGVDGTHPDHKFGQNLVQNVLSTINLNAYSSLLPVSYQEDVINTDTNSGHGTHVAGTVGGTGAQSGGKYEGVAPGADLIGFGSGGALFILDALTGFDYAITNQQRYNIRIITNSWGSSGDFDPTNPINLASKKAYDRGITVLFAAGNSGPGENTHNPYAKAPWVISVGAGVKDGSLASFSSRGTDGKGGEFEVDGETWTWKDEPTLVAPGVDIISTKTLSPLTLLSADKDAKLIEAGYLPYYATMSGTSMATPHVAGIVALMLEADPTLAPEDIKDILQSTSTNMPGYKTWEVGSGYVNAYAAIDAIVFGNEYGATLNQNQTFNSSVETDVARDEFSVSYDPTNAVSPNPHVFTIDQPISNVTARVDARGLMGETGNPLNLVLIAPDGTEYSSGISLLFTLTTDRTVSVDAPMVGEWSVEVRGLRGNESNPVGAGLPETVTGTLSFTQVTDVVGLKDIEGHPAEEAIKLGIQARLFDGYKNGQFRPDRTLTKGELAYSLVMGAGIRQNLSNADTSKFKDVSDSDVPFFQAVTSKGAALRDLAQQNGPVIKPASENSYSSNTKVIRETLAFSLVQSLGLEKMAKNFEGDVTVQYKDERVILADQDHIAPELKGYVQLALDLNLINASFTFQQGEFDLEPEVTATFSPKKEMSRGEYAIVFNRFYRTWFQ